MGLFPLFSKSAKSVRDIPFDTTFIPLDLVNALISGGINANQQKFLELYLSVPELQAVINYKARVFAGMRVVAENSKGEEIAMPQLSLFTKPNPLQGFKEFAVQYYTLRAIFGNAFIHPVFGLDPKKAGALWNLPPMDAEVVPAYGDGIPFNMTDADELIAEYKFKWDGGQIKYEPNEIIHYNDNQVKFDKDNIMLGDSKIRPLVQACENIKHAYEARGILISQSPRGILSNKTTDGIGSIGLKDDEKEKVQEDMRNAYGLTRKKWQVVITNSSLDWTSMAADVGKMKLFEETEADYRTICNAYAFPPPILQPNPGTALNATEVNESIAQLYHESIIPESNEWLQGIANWMGVDVVLKADFSHVAVLQTDLERRSKSINWAATGLAKALEKGLIEIEEGKEEMKKYLS